jgi:membrane fusion protein (multidrug efflux system)
MTALSGSYWGRSDSLSGRRRNQRTQRESVPTAAAQPPTPMASAMSNYVLGCRMAEVVQEGRVRKVSRKGTPARWLPPLFRILFLVAAVWFVWFTSANWNRWTGAARFVATDDAFVVGDVTPLAAHVSGYITNVAVNDYQAAQKGDLIAEIDPSDYRAQLVLAKANLEAARAGLANVVNQKDVQRALIREASANIEATEADVVRYGLESKRQRNLLEGGIAGTRQAFERADADARRTIAQKSLNEAQLDQQKAALAGLDIQEKQIQAQVEAAEAQVALATNNLDYTRIVSPADGMVGQRQVRPGQFVNVGTQLITVVPLPNVWVIGNFKETQMTNVRVGQAVRVTVDAFPDVTLEGRVETWSPGTGSIFALLPPDNATGNFTKVVQRVPVKIILEKNPALGSLVRPGMSVVATINTEARASGASDRAVP